MILLSTKEILHRIINLYSSVFILLGVFFSSTVFAELKLESVYPNQGVLGQDLAVTLKGTGFDENARVSMTLDVGNIKFIIGSIQTFGQANGVTLVGNTAYVVSVGWQKSRLTVIDIQNS